MFKYNKIIATLSIAICVGTTGCHATESKDELDDIERCLGHSIRFSHQDPLRQEALIEYNKPTGLVLNSERELEGDNNYSQNICLRFDQLEPLFDSTYGALYQRLHYYCSLPIFRDYVCQVAASVTSGLILYGLYQALKTPESH